MRCKPTQQLPVMFAFHVAMCCLRDRNNEFYRQMAEAIWAMRLPMSLAPDGEINLYVSFRLFCVYLISLIGVVLFVEQIVDRIFNRFRTTHKLRGETLRWKDTFRSLFTDREDPLAIDNVGISMVDQLICLDLLELPTILIIR